MKLKNFIKISALPALLMASAVAFAIAKPQKAKSAFATDYGSISITGIDNVGDTNDIYLVPGTNDIPNSWSIAYNHVGEDSGVFLNGVKESGAIKKADNWIYFHPSRNAQEGDVVEFKGTFSSGSDSFTLDYTVMRFGGIWVKELEDFDVLSLKDANMPDFENGNINTEDTGGYGYIGYDESGYAKKFAPKQKGLFGLTNETGSYAFQFNFEANGKLTSWFTVRIGASGGWTTGHYLKFNFTNIWADTGCVVVSENEGDGDYASHKQEVVTDISDGQRLLKMGAIKVKGTANQYYVFFVNNGATSFGKYWDLATGTMSTKVGIYAPDTNISVTNAVNPAETKVRLSSDSTASALYFNTTSDILPFVHTWGEHFIPQDSTSFTYNGVDASNDKANYFKKVGATNNALFLGFGDAGITPVKGDTFHLGGVFKVARYAASDNVTVLYKIVIQDCDFEFDGTKWAAGNPSYEAGDFAKDLLKLTRPVCSAASDGNGSALGSIWATLNDEDHYQALFMAEKELIKDGSPDASVVVPNTDTGIEEMLPEDAIGAALYRYDYCCAKYSLTNFIDRTLTVSFGSNLLNPVTVESNNTFIIIVIISIVSISTLGLLVCKRKHR